MTPQTPAVVVPAPAAAEQVSGGDVLGEVTSPPENTWYDELGPAAAKRLREVRRWTPYMQVADDQLVDVMRYLHQQTVKVALLRKHADALANGWGCECGDDTDNDPICPLCRYETGVVR